VEQDFFNAIQDKRLADFYRLLGSSRCSRSPTSASPCTAVLPQMLQIEWAQLAQRAYSDWLRERPTTGCSSSITAPTTRTTHREDLRFFVDYT